MHTTYLLTGHNPNGTIDEIIGTFDTPELAQEFVSQNVWETDSVWRKPHDGHWTLGRWRIVALPHNGLDSADWK